MFATHRVRQCHTIHCRWKSSKISSKLDLSNFLSFENGLSNASSPLSSLDSKIDFLIQHHTKVSILDLNIPNDKISTVFLKLVKNRAFDFNAVNLKGLGTFFKLLLKNTSNGIDIIKNCGILNSKNRDEIFTSRYNQKLQLLTISILLENQCYDDAYHFIKLFDSIYPSNKLTTKYKFKLSKFAEFEDCTVSPSQLIDENLIHIYANALIRYPLSQEQKLESFLLILFKWLELKKLKGQNTTTNEIHLFNSNFLSLLNNQVSISYNIFLSYYIKLYPSSIPLLQDLCLVSSTNSILKNRSPALKDLPQVNIKSELIQSCQPYMSDLAMLYSKYLNENLPDRTTTKQLFNHYIANVKHHQSRQLSNIPHPFDTTHHDSSILLSFLKYTFNLKVGLNKPKLSANLIVKFYDELITCRINKSQISEFESVIRILQNMNRSSSQFDFILLTRLLSELESQNIALDINIYFDVIDTLIRLNFIEDAKRIYNYIINHPTLSTKTTIKQVSPLCYRYSWPYPKHLLEKSEISQPRVYTYRSDYLSPPQDVIKALDSQLETHRKVNNI